ncbi:MAG: transglutaminase-like domain-containing protein [Bacillota bacterium]
MKIKSMPGKIPDILLAQLVAFSLVYALESALALKYPLIYMAACIFILVFMFCIMFFSKKTSIASFSLIGTALTAFAAYILRKYDFNEIWTFIDEYYSWLRQYMLYHDLPHPLFGLITMMALCIAASAFSYYFIVKKFNFIVVLISGMAIFVVQWIYELATGLTPFYLFLAAMLNAYLRQVYIIKSSGEPNEYAGNAPISIWGFPVSLIIFGLSLSFNASDKPIQWEWLDRKIASAYNYLVKNFDYESFDYFSLSASSGFGGMDGQLGGKVRLDRTNVLYVTSGKRIYLKGASMDEYTGKNWTGGIPSFKPAGDYYSAVFDDYGEMMQGMKLLSGDDDFLEKYFEPNPVTVTFLNLWTKSIFMPYGAYEFNPVSGGFSGFLSDTGDFSSEKRLGKGFKYALETYSPRLGDKEFEDLLRKSKRGFYKECLDRIYGSSPETEDTYEVIIKLSEKSVQIYERYLRLPENLPQRVKDLSLSLTASRENNYDKAKAIEQYLASNFPYNLDVRSTPRNRDFVDYFLFDMKEGYCTYFASAMTVLARCAGLPARYVEGYMLPSEPLEDNRSAYIVSNMQAHAWVEIYLEGYGWLPFEPTPPFRTSFYETRIVNENFSSNYDAAYQDYVDMMMRQAGGQDGYTDTGGITTTEDGLSVTFLVIIGIGIFILLPAALLLVNMFRSKLYFYRMINLSMKESVTKLYEYYVKMLDLGGYSYFPAETPSLYAERIDSNVYFGPVKFKAITDVFLKARYSLHEPSENEKQLVASFNPEFQKAVKADMGKLKYFVMKYILGRF